MEFDRVLNVHLHVKRCWYLRHGKDQTGCSRAYYVVSRKGLSAKRALKILRRFQSRMR